MKRDFITIVIIVIVIVIIIIIIIIISQQQNALGSNLSMQGVGGVATAAFGTWIRRLARGYRKGKTIFHCWSVMAVGLHSWVTLFFS